MIINPSTENTPSGFEYRKATNADCSIIINIVHNALLEFGLTPEPDATDKDLSDIETNYAKGYFGVILQNDEVVATFALTPLDEHAVEIRRMFSIPEVRGQGVGKWMINYLLEIAKSNGYAEAELETASPLVNAIGLYKKLGFQEKQFENKTPRCDKTFILPL